VVDVYHSCVDMVSVRVRECKPRYHWTTQYLLSCFSFLNICGRTVSQMCASGECIWYCIPRTPVSLDNIRILCVSVSLIQFRTVSAVLDRSLCRRGVGQLRFARRQSVLPSTLSPRLTPQHLRRPCRERPVVRTQSTQRADRLSAVIGCCIWNQLHIDIRTLILILPIFNHKLPGSLNLFKHNTDCLCGEEYFASFTIYKEDDFSTFEIN
jgi:hypothetical protein